MDSIEKIFSKAGKLAGKAEKNVKYAETKQIVAGLFGVAVSSFEKGRAEAREPEQEEFDFESPPYPYDDA
jgi:hypothetical protein|tara:strand:- start:97 stop:306 length:210 start_codon:yes stop_codon:yes gene_type:complete